MRITSASSPATGAISRSAARQRLNALRKSWIATASVMSGVSSGLRALATMSRKSSAIALAAGSG